VGIFSASSVDDPAALVTSNGETWVQSEDQSHYVPSTTPDPNAVLVPITLITTGETGETLIAVAPPTDDYVELTLGSTTHMLNMEGYNFAFDATVINNIAIGGSSGANSILVTGTDLEDYGRSLNGQGTLSSSAYVVNTYGFQTITFNGSGGADTAELFGTDGNDTLQSLPQDSTLTTPNGVSRVIGFERLDAYGRGGTDYGALYGTYGSDYFYRAANLEIMLSQGIKQVTKGFERIDAFGRGGNDFAYTYDTAGNDHYYSFDTFSIVQSGGRKAVIKDFENVQGASTQGGDDVLHFHDLGTNDVLHATPAQTTLDMPARDESFTGYLILDLWTKPGETPSFNLEPGPITISLNGILL